MNRNIEIKITIPGAEVSAGGAQFAAANDVPKPSDELAGIGASFGSGAAPSPSDALGLGDFDTAAPSPSDALGSGALDTAAPSPMMEGAVAGSAAETGLPTPVPLGEIEQLGSSTAAIGGAASVPAPEGEA